MEDWFILSIKIMHGVECRNVNNKYQTLFIKIWTKCWGGWKTCSWKIRQLCPFLVVDFLVKPHTILHQVTNTKWVKKHRKGAIYESLCKKRKELKPGRQGFIIFLKWFFFLIFSPLSNIRSPYKCMYVISVKYNFDYLGH